MQKQKSNKQKSNHTKCKHTKKIRFNGNIYCICQSQKGGYQKFNPKYAEIINMLNLFVVGGQSGTGSQDNWWELCINGKAPLTGITPSKCVFY